MAGEPQLTGFSAVQRDNNANRGGPRLHEFSAVQRYKPSSPNPFLTGFSAVQRAERKAWPPYLTEFSAVQRFAGLLPPPPPNRPPTTHAPAPPVTLEDRHCVSDRMQVQKGNAPDAWVTLGFTETRYRALDIWTWDHTLELRWAPWDNPTAWGSADEIPADGYKSFDARVAAVQVRNKVPGSVSRYQVLGSKKRPDWADRMLASYLSFNSHATPSVAAQVELLSRLQPGGYLYTTFGPGGLNKTECDFLKLFEFNGDLVGRPVTKAGAVLRWDIDSTIYAQNNWPIHVIDPAKPNVITVSTTDGWNGLTTFECAFNNITGTLPSFADCTNLTAFFGHMNGFVGALPSFAACTNLDTFYCHTNGFTGALPSFAVCTGLLFFLVHDNNFVGTLPSFAACTGLINFMVYDNNFVGVLPPFATCPNLVYHYFGMNGFTTYNREAIHAARLWFMAGLSNFDQTSIDNFLLDYELIKTPMALSGNDYYINLGFGGANAPPSAVGIAAKNAIIAEFAATPGSGVLTIMHN